jgi:hypothetical protein
MKSSRQAFNGAPRSTWFSIHYVTVVAILFAAVVMLNITDLWTSMTALGMGLTEGNGLVIWLSNSLGLSVIGGLALIKIAAVVGGFGAAMLGIKFRDPVVRKTAVAVMTFLMIYLLAISINNLYQIYL